MAPGSADRRRGRPGHGRATSCSAWPPRPRPTAPTAAPGSAQLPGVWGGAFSYRRGADHYYLLPDFQGHTRQLANAAGAIFEPHIYDAWGREIWPIITTGLYLRGFGQWGYWRDTASREYVRARHLRADLGRWMSMDPLAWAGAGGYIYAVGGPTNRMDPLGLKDYKFGTDHPVITHDRGAGPYGSRYRTFEGWVFYMALLRVVIPYVRSRMPDAAAHLEHYLGNTGKQYTIRLAQMISDDSAARALLASELKEAMTFVQSLPSGTHCITSRRASSGVNYSENWNRAVGGYSAWGEGIAVVEGHKYALAFEYHFEDMYNWDSGKSAYFG